MEENLQTVLDRIQKNILSKLVDGKCKKCGKDIKVMIDEPDDNLCEECFDTQLEYKKRILKLDYILPLGYKNMSFENFVIRPSVKNIDVALKIAKRFVQDNTGVYLYGAAGQGKTHLLIAALRECVLQGKSVKLLRYSSELKNYKDRGLKKEDFFEEYSNCECLFVDDFGSVGSKDDAIDILYGILQRRIEKKRGKKIFITANVALSQIEDDRVKSRVVGMCTGYMCHDNDVDVEKYVNIIELNGKDIRLEGRL